MAEDLQEPLEHSEDTSTHPLGHNYTPGAPLSIYLLGILVEHIKLPWRAVFYEVPFQDLKASIIAHLPGLPFPKDTGDGYAYFQIIDAQSKELCTILLRNLNHGLYQILRQISVELRLSGTSSDACVAIVQGLIKGIAADFGNAGTVHIRYATEPQDSAEMQDEVPEGTRRFSLLFLLKNENPSLTANQVAIKYEEMTGNYISEDTS
jgi:hypothetical protein